MRGALQGLVLGGSVFATAYVAQRLIAPYSGLSLALYCGIAFSTLLGFAVGCAPGARTRSAERSGPPARPALLAAAILSLLIALARRPLLVALWGVDIRVTIAIASVAFA